ncbi:MAG: hypothetical protein Q8P05_02545 [Candidatus Diapherotrites archaeon]|nr:hypothetical protein [Candidatus Diapherotrites archaeon]MDZ4256892.1 hypothetical protein [archaeon]
MHYAIRPDTPIAGLPHDLHAIHLVRAISARKMEAVLKHCPHLEEIRVSPSVRKRLSPRVNTLLTKHAIRIGGGAKAGRALGINLATVQAIADLKKDFLSVRAISAKVGVPKSTVHYLLKKAKREKIRNGRHVIHVA